MGMLSNVGKPASKTAAPDKAKEKEQSVSANEGFTQADIDAARMEGFEEGRKATIDRVKALRSNDQLQGKEDLAIDLMASSDMDDDAIVAFLANVEAPAKNVSGMLETLQSQEDESIGSGGTSADETEEQREEAALQASINRLNELNGKKNNV